MKRIAKRHDTSAKPTRKREVPDVRPAHEAEHGVPHELDAVEQRIQVAEHLRPLGQLVEREEGARDEEHRREQSALPVGEGLDRLRPGGDEDPEAGPAEPGQRGDLRHEQHPPARVEPEDNRDEHRDAPVDAGPGPDPQRLGGDELLGVDGRGEDRVVGVLELVLDERRVHGGEGAREQDRRGHDARSRRNRCSRSRRPCSPASRTRSRRPACRSSDRRSRRTSTSARTTRS